MQKITLKQFHDKYKLLVQSRKYREAKELLYESSTDNSDAKDLVNRCRVDFNVAIGNLEEAKKELEKGEIKKLKSRSDYILTCKVIRALATSSVNDYERYENELIDIFKKNLNDVEIIHEVCNYLSYRRYNEQANTLYKYGKNINKENTSLEYDYGRHLLSIGKINDGISKYKLRNNLPYFKSTITINSNEFIHANLIKEYILINKELNVIGEQGIGDQVRILYLVQSVAKKFKIKIKYYCDKRISEYYVSEHVEIYNIADYKQGRCVLGFDLLELYKFDPNEIINYSNGIEMKIRTDIEIPNDSVGMVFSTITRSNYGQSIDAISPTLNELIERKIFNNLEESKVFSLQYGFENFNLKYKNDLKVFHSKNLDYTNDWAALFSITSQCQMLIGPDSSQTIICSTSAKKTEMLSVKFEPLYLGLNTDPYIKGVKIIDLNKLRNYKINQRLIEIEKYIIK
jgi:hypothetical protein